MPLNALLLRQLIKSGVLKVVNKETLDTLSSYAGRQALNVGKVVAQRKAQGIAIKPGLQHYGVSEATRLTKAQILKAYNATTLNRYPQAVGHKLHRAGLQISANVGEYASRAEFRLLGGPKGVMTDPFGTMLNDPTVIMPTMRAFARHQQVLKAYHSKGSRFVRAGTNQFVVDYASFQLVNISMQVLEEMFPHLGPTDEDDPMDWTPYSSALTAQTERAGGYAGNEGLDDQILNIAAGALVGSAVSSKLNRFRKNRVALDNMSFSASTKFGERVSQNTMAARSYYGSRIPEVSGNLLGATASLFALGGDPRQVASTLGVRGLGNAATGFYNYGKPRQAKFPKMPKRRPKMPTTVKQVKARIKKYKQTKSAVQYLLDPNQQRLF